MSYLKNIWKIFNPDIPEDKQPDAFITKEKLDHMEEGIEVAHQLAENAKSEVEIGEVVSGETASAEIVDKKLNLVLPKGDKGNDGQSAYTAWLLQGNDGSEEDFLNAIKGEPGKSAYQIWLDAGNEGTEEEFLLSLKGVDGTGFKGDPGEQGVGVENVTASLEEDGKTITFVFELTNNIQIPVSVTLP